MSAKAYLRAQRIRRLLASHRWVTQTQLIRASGHRFGAYLYSIRRGDDGGPPLKVDSRCVSPSDGRWVYRCTGIEKEPARPVSLRRKVKLLEREVAELRRRLEASHG